jgi:LmbE family N-acetylglucosaminyl deacetylase
MSFQGLRLRLGLEGTRRPLDEAALRSVRRATVVLAHMDDEINACGLLARLRAVGCDVDVVVLTDGAANPWTDARVVGARTHFECRRDELRESLRALGITQVTLPGLPDSRLREHLDTATALVTAHLRARQSDLVISFDPSGINGHADHVAAHVASRRALAASAHPTALACITPPPPFSYVLGSRFRSSAPVTIGTLRLSPREHALKVHLCATYASQARTLRLLMLGLPARSFFRLFPWEWYLWLDAPEAAAWARANEPHALPSADLPAAPRADGHRVG